MPSSAFTAGLTAAVCLGVLGLSAFGYRATVEWQRSSERLIRQQENEGARLLVMALMRDMRGAQSAVLADRDWGELMTDEPRESVDLVASAFARYPYPESFFTWQESAPIVTFFNRGGRLPSWMAGRGDSPFPVILATNPPGIEQLRTTVANFARAHRQYAVFDASLGGQEYQVVARLTYGDPLLEHVKSVTGFTVNLDWIRHSYFAEILNQVSGIAGANTALDLAVVDDRQHVVSGTDNGLHPTQVTFPLLFVDPSAAAPESGQLLTIPLWAVRVSAKPDSALLRTTRGADRMVLATGAAVCALGFAFVLLARTVRAGVALAEMRSDFVASVTHDLKTPLAGIRALADTLVNRRQVDSDTVREYARLMAQESKRLTRRVDNLLAYARVTDVTEIYTFEPIAAVELVDDVLQDFSLPIAEGGFSVTVDVHPDLPLIRGDRTALMLALGNLLDNAIRYSGEQRVIRIAAVRAHGRVLIEVVDHGVGIPAEELPSVQRKFVRGRLARADGSGLGLAIVNRIVADHGGTLALESSIGVGTRASLEFPAEG